MPVFRVEKKQQLHNNVQLPPAGSGSQPERKGLLSMLLSLPDTWNYSVQGLSSITPDGVDGVLTALKELERLKVSGKEPAAYESNGRMGRAEICRDL